MIKLKQILDEKFYDIVRDVGKDKGDWIDLEKSTVKNQIKKDFPTRENLFDLINSAYMNALNSPHVGIKSPDDIVGSEYDYWEAIDINENPYADAVLFGKRKFGIKLSGIGHNGEKLSKQVLLKYQVELLNKNGYWVEASSPVADIMKAKGAPIFTDKEKIQKLFPNSHFTKWYDDGSYNRAMDNKSRNSSTREYVFGNPKI